MIFLPTIVALLKYLDYNQDFRIRENSFTSGCKLKLSTTISWQQALRPSMQLHIWQASAQPSPLICDSKEGGGGFTSPAPDGQQ